MAVRAPLTVGPGRRKRARCSGPSRTSCGSSWRSCGRRGPRPATAAGSRCWRTVRLPAAPMLGLPVPRPLMRTHVVRVRVCLNFCSRPVSTTGLRRCPRLSRGGRARGHKGAGAPAGLRAPAARRRRRGGRIHAGGPAELPKPVPAGALQPRRARATALRRRAAAQRPAAWPARVLGARQGRGRIPPGRCAPGRCTRAPPGAPARGGRIGAGPGSR